MVNRILKLRTHSGYHFEKKKPKTKNKKTTISVEHSKNVIFRGIDKSLQSPSMYGQVYFDWILCL